MGQNHFYVTLTNNDINGFGLYDVKLYYCGRVNVTNNYLRTSNNANSLYVISTIDHVSIDQNTVNNYIFVHPSSNHRITIGETYGDIQSTYLRGYTIIPAGQTSATTTFSSMNGSPANFKSGSPSYIMPYACVETPISNIGSVWATVNDSKGVILWL